MEQLAYAGGIPRLHEQDGAQGVNMLLEYLHLLWGNETLTLYLLRKSSVLYNGTVPSSNLFLSLVVVYKYKTSDSDEDTLTTCLCLSCNPHPYRF